MIVLCVADLAPPALEAADLIRLAADQLDLCTVKVDSTGVDRLFVGLRQADSPPRAMVGYAFSMMTHFHGCGTRARSSSHVNSHQPAGVVSGEPQHDVVMGGA